MGRKIFRGWSLILIFALVISSVFSFAKVDYVLGEENPITVAEAIVNNTGTKSVVGYIVGTVTTGPTYQREGPFTVYTNLAIADSPEETDASKILPVQLPSGSIRTELNLVDNPQNLGKKIVINGSLEAYFGVSGLKSPTGYQWVPEEGGVLSISHTPVATAREGEDIPINFTVANETGSVTGAVYHKYTNEITYNFINTTGSAIIPAAEVVEGEIEYYIEVQDDNDIVRSPETGAHIITIQPQLVVSTIAEIKGLPVGTEMAVEGIVTTNPGSFGGKGFYLQDSTAGVYSFHFSNDFGVERGNLIRLVGTTSEYNGGFQISPTAVEILSTSTVEPTAREIAISDIGLNNEGQLVTVNAVTVTSFDSDNYKTAMLTITDGINTGIIKLDNRTGYNSDQLAAKVTVGDELDVVGVVGYQSNEYRVLLRDLDDVTVLGASTVAPVVATPEAGAVTAGTQVTLTTATEGAAILYTTGAGDPDTEYTQPIVINEATTIKAMATKEGLNNSSISTFAYTMREEGVLPILEVKKLPLNSTAELRGVVTALTGSSNREAYIQDEMAGLQINLPDIATKVKVGDIIKASGQLQEYRGELQFVPASLEDVIVESGNNPLPQVMDVSLKQVSQANGRISVDTALINYQGNEGTITVRGVITDVLPNGQYAMEIADQVDPTRVMSVALPAEYREEFSPYSNPSAVGRIVLVTGQEKNYFNKPAIRQVSSYDPNTGISTKGEFHVGYDIEGMMVATEAFEVVSKDGYGFIGKTGEVEAYIYTGRATNFNLSEIEIGDWYSAKGIVAYYNRPQLKLIDGGDLKAELPPNGKDPSNPLVLDAKPGNFVSTFNQSPLISARLEATAAAIDFNNVRLLFNGIRVEHTLDASTGIISYQTANLDYGEHDVVIYVPDVEGRMKEFNWFFRVEKENPNYNFYYGIPHAHTAYSDGAGTPNEAYEYAKTNNLDWLFITDHSNWLDGVTEGNYEYDPVANEYVEVVGSQWHSTRLEAEAINEKYAGEFLAIRGFEMTSSIWGHTNSINSDTYVEAKKQMVPLSEYYDWVTDVSTRSGAKVFNAFNHPNWPDDSFNNLAYVASLDRYFNGIEVGNGAPPYSYARAEGHYFKALDNGWRLGALNGQDNHAKNWGDPDSLTVVIAESLDTDTLIDAMNARRMYSTETRTLELTVKGNGHWMGSVLDVNAGDEINLDILAEDSMVKIDKLQLITNGGNILDEKVFSGGTNSAAWNLTLNASGGAQWFVVKVIHSNGGWGHASPIFTAAGENDVKLTNITVNPNPTLPGFNTEVEATVSNMGLRAVDGIEVNFYANSISSENLIDVVALDGKLDPGASTKLSTTWLPVTHGEQRVFAVLTPISGVTTVTEISTNVKVVKPIGKKILFDGGHNNADVPGTVVKIIEMLRLYGYEAVINTKKYTPELLENVDVLIINTPLNADNGFTEAEEEAIAAWVNAGGAIMMASKSNYNQDSTILNSLMTEIGSTIRFNNDNIYEPEGSSKYTGGMVWSIIMENLPSTPSGLNENMEAIRIFSGCSLVTEVNGGFGPLVNNPETGLEILLYANDTSYNALAGSNAYIYNEEGQLNGDTIPVIATERVGNGRLVAAGRHFYSDFEIGNNVSNTVLTLQTIDWLAGYDRVRTITDIRENAVVGDVVTVRGIVTAPTNHFFDVVYIQDETSGVAIYGSQLHDNLPIGTEIIATGKVTYFEGELELAFENYDYEVLYIGPIEPVIPTKVSTNEAMAAGVEGKLVTTEGIIVNYNEVDGNFSIDDGSGEAFVQIDGYLNLGMDRFKLGDRVSVTGVVSHGSVGPRIRVRFYDDLELAEEIITPTIQLEGVIANKTNFQPKSTIPFKFSILNVDGVPEAMDDVTVKIYDGDNLIVIFEEGRGPNRIHRAGKPGQYKVNIHTNSLKIQEGEYTIVIEFNYDDERISLHAVDITIGKNKDEQKGKNK
ncbi:DUF6359 domain-containing protein [Alkaliphilus serpentinus]|uniref:Polymerase/histidinol phosphatase N-terminal domain-containing protein n=1 Tax=Alkaliphilus serpentinus TaxID=1482731 RepID=A0A833HPB8_9FIRM|nr:DUF6359 domain-containing protein [Alkaliphilus serpentinus]KAB3530522.1 hypothetical protein F8153_06635 [Alkaliphilus serpentinus]